MLGRKRDTKYDLENNNNKKESNNGLSQCSEKLVLFYIHITQ